ncbi:MAG: type IX secretion system membrane protein PorP/SprF [Parvicellaceae bacterium]
MNEKLILLKKIHKQLLNLFLIAVAVVSIDLSAFGQDPEFTQFYSNPIYLNPAFAGSRGCPRFVMNHRNEWPNISGNFVTTAAAYDQKVDGLRGGLGFLVLNDNAANTLSTTRASLMYAYHLKITRKFSLNFGVEGSYYQKAIDWDKLTFGDMIDPRRGFVYQTNQVRKDEPVNNLDFSAGVVGYTENFYFGFAAHHLTTPDESFINNAESPLPMKLTGHAGAVIPLDGGSSSLYSDDKKPTISPNILYTRQGTTQQLNMGVYVKKGALVGGVWYRNKDSFILTVGLESDMIKVGYSYDVTMSQLSVISGGSHEVSLGINFFCKPKKKQFRPISCPSF